MTIFILCNLILTLSTSVCVCARRGRGGACVQVRVCVCVCVRARARRCMHFCAELLLRSVSDVGLYFTLEYY